MPKQYLAIKESLLKKGYSDKEAKKHAAMIYNAVNPGHPLIREKKEKKNG
jgi:hypothetical protein